MKANDLRDQFAGTLTEARDIAAKAEAEDREYSGDERETLRQLTAKARDLTDQIKTLDGDADLRRAIADLGAGVDFSPPPPPSAPVPAGKGRTLGDQFAESREFKEWMSRISVGGMIPDSAKGLHSPPVQFKTLLTGTSDTSAGAMVANDATGIYVPLGRRPLVLRDIITNGRTTSDTVEFVQVTSETNAAAPVAEATATATGGTKPESAMALAKVTAPVRTIAHWIPATKRALSDAGQLRTIIDNFLRDGLEEELEDQMISGPGTGETMTGIANTVGIQTQAWDTDILTTTRKARTKVQTVGRARPTAFLLHPTDWQTIDLLKDTSGRFYFGGPVMMGTPTLWGLPVVESEGCTPGEGYVADFRKAVLWDRESASITVSDSHSDFFVRNLIAILAELRAAFGVIQPTAFVEIDLLAA